MLGIVALNRENAYKTLTVHLYAVLQSGLTVGPQTGL